jgi:hypothetical protein
VDNFEFEFNENVLTIRGRVPTFYLKQLLQDETAISLAVGVMSRSAVDVFDLLRQEALQLLIWRQRLPSPDDSQSEDSAGTRETLRHVLEQLAADATSTLKSPSFLNRVVETFQL